MNCSPDRERMSSDEDLVAKLRHRYVELHSNNQFDDDDQSFSRLLGESSESKVQEYLDGLAEAYSKVQGLSPDLRNLTWQRFLHRVLGGRDFLVAFYQVKQGSDFDQQLIKLAFFHQYPRWAQQENVDEKRMLEALVAGSVAAGEKLLTAAVNDSEHVKILQAGYQHDYLRQETIVLPILKRISKAAQEWSTDHLVPLTSLIGPSMIGKTRLLQQLSKSICVVYLCLRPLGSTGLPPRSKLADELTPAKTTAPELELHYTRLLAAIFDVVAEFFSKQLAPHSKEERLQQWFNFNDKSGNEFASRVVERLKQIAHNQREASESLQTNLEKLQDKTQFVENPHLKVLLAINEARLLVQLETSDLSRVTYFWILQRILSKIPSSKGFFAIVTDTTIKVADFNPTLYNDPSARPPPDYKPKKLFAPIYDIGTFDSKVPPGRPWTWEELLSPRRLLSYGVPFFGVYVKEAEARGMAISVIVTNIREIAIAKLLCIPPTSTLSEGQMFAMLGSTIQPQIYEAARLNSELISSHLAHCLYISPSGERIISGYPSQFPLSMAANYFLATDNNRLISCIKALTVILQQGLISSGNAGELATQIILLRAMHKAMSISTQTHIPYGCSVKLADFLYCLTGLEEENLDLGNIAPQQKKRLLAKGRIFWNHFVQITYTPNVGDFLEFLYRGLAIQCKPNQPAFDQLFTIYLESDQPNSALNQDHISFCGIQAKNEQVGFGKEIPKWTDQYAGITINSENPYLVIIFSFKTKSTPQKLPEIDNRGSLIFHGLSQIDCLTDGMSEALQELLAVDPDIRDFHNNNHMQTFIETICPIVYPVRRPASNVENVLDSDINLDALSKAQDLDCQMND
ncbi:hypothetical protein PGT21_032595 [Puccinia graminis f. sp. tritici]|uniref:Uncharacterized protein n=1 Tax=Puccinia graminis f. sp. tritici TaxID=56615 RepID=A0A5B0PCE4_PUCGR|nr:hypothetical protein PGT21_032595 [Puccinia graminis f. sp. tritici]